jgi:hypothetical protein
VSDDADGAVVVDRDSETLVVATEKGVLVFDRLELQPVLMPMPSTLVARDDAPASVVIAKDIEPQLVIAGFKGDKGDKGDPGAGGAGSTYVYKQASAASVWPIEHDLNEYPSVTVVDSAGSVVVGAITYVDSNNIVLNFSAPFAGTAYLN